MKKNYHIEAINSEMYPIMIFSVSYVSPVDVIANIENDLKSFGVKGKIIFDFLLCNGDNPDRYFEAVFDGSNIDQDSFKQIDFIDKKIRQISSRFYIQSNKIPEYCAISKPHRYVLNKRNNTS